MTTQPRNSVSSQWGRRTALVLTVIAGLVGAALRLHDTILLVFAVAAIGLVWSTRGWRAWALGGALIAGGLTWSSLDETHCSAWWRTKILATKLAGDLPLVEWPDVWRSFSAPCYTPFQPHPRAEQQVELTVQKTVNGRLWEQYRTPLGNFWIPAPGRELMTWLLWEVALRSDYESGPVAIRTGDIVVDAGAHVGVFTRYALTRGARRVIAIEPDSTNLACLRANLADEISDGRVSVAPVGIWNKRSFLPLLQAPGNSAGHTFVGSLEGDHQHHDQNGSSESVGIPLLPLDDVVEDLGLERVDYIKMDIEGSERYAVRGAQQTIRRFRPRMAICSYHRTDDPEEVVAAVRAVREDYRIDAREIDLLSGSANPKVLFFE